MASGIEHVASAARAAGAEVARERAIGPSTTLRVGGEAALIVTVHDEDAIVRTVGAAYRFGVPLLVLGRGSNLLVPDSGWPGLVLRLGSGLRGIRIEGTRVVVGGAEPMPSVAVRTARAGLAGFAWGASVPGSMGGGVRMNAGAHGADMSDSLVSARVVDGRSGSVEEWDRDRFEFGYRASSLGPLMIVAQVTLRLHASSPDVELTEIETIMDWRRRNQPLDRPSCGSVFVNPPGVSAGELIERAGLKGHRHGGAQISTRHANFIVTEPGATATDVEALIALTIDRVREVTGFELRTEVVRPRPDEETER